jgi:FecR protein
MAAICIDLPEQTRYPLNSFGLASRKPMKARATALFVGLCLGSGGLLPSPVWAQSNSAQPQPAVLDTKPVGKVVTVTGIASIEHAAAVVVQANLPPGSAVQARPGDSIYRGDLIQTGSEGSLAVTFADGTSFNVSSNARMEVNEFIYDPNSQSNSTLLSLTKGTFTFIAGNVAHTGSMKVDTPLGTMGIRGTAPRVEILDDGSVKFSTLVEQK